MEYRIQDTKKFRQAVLEAELGSLEIDLARTAVVVIDMQNAFVSEGGMCDLRGDDITTIRQAVKPIKEIVSLAREKSVKVIYIAHSVYGDERDISPDSPFWHSRDMKTFREKPELRDKLIIRGTWGAQLVEALTPEKEDLLIEKPRFSAFFGTGLDTVLRAHDIKYLVFTGVKTNVCVETSVRDAYHLEYFPILVSDACAASLPAAHDMAISNIKRCFGWVTTAEKLSKAFTAGD